MVGTTVGKYRILDRLGRRRAGQRDVQHAVAASQDESRRGQRHAAEPPVMTIPAHVYALHGGHQKVMRKVVVKLCGNTEVACWNPYRTDRGARASGSRFMNCPSVSSV